MLSKGTCARMQKIILPEWICICAMLSQNAVHPDAKGTMMLQLVDAESKRKGGRKLKRPEKKKQKPKKKINEMPQRSAS